MTTTTWRRACASASACIETAATWHKSTRCAANGTCIEAAGTPGAVLVRDSTDPHGPRITLTARQWRGLLDAIKETR